MNHSEKRLKIFTWHIHGSYLFYLSKGNFDLYIPTKPIASEGYYGRGETFPFGENVIEVPVEKVKHLDFDCILFQSENNYLADQYEILSSEQRKLPKVYLEHDPPLDRVPYTKHVVNDPNVVIVHVTAFNKMMWDNNHSPAIVIDHGIWMREVPEYSGEKERGIVVINNLEKRGRRLGYDIFLEVQQHIPLDLYGMGNGSLGKGEILHPELPAAISQYRFFFNPIRYTSLGLAILESMFVGTPVVALATTELPTTLVNGKSGFLSNDTQKLIATMKTLLADKDLARQVGREGQKVAEERFNISRFTKDWEDLFKRVSAQKDSLKLEIY